MMAWFWRCRGLQIVVAGLGLPWLGYMAGAIISKVLRQDGPDCLAIAVEAGIQNTGIAIFILRFALGQVRIEWRLCIGVKFDVLLFVSVQPQADLTTVIPVSVAMMTPLPLMGYWIYLRCRRKYGFLSKIHSLFKREIR